MKITKTLVKAEAVRVFGARASIELDAYDGRFWCCRVAADHGIELRATRDSRMGARRHLWRALLALAPAPDRDSGEGPHF